MDLPMGITGKLKDLKKKVEASHQYFRKNAERYEEFMRFVFQSALTNEDIVKLQTLMKPTIEFNICEAYISRLRGEFAKQEPGIVVRASDAVRDVDLTPEFLDMLEVIEAHLRDIISSTSNDGLQYNIYTDLLGGGYSVVEIYTDYINELSFDHKINVQRVFDPTLCGFDPLARTSHKGDGQYCFQIFPKTKEEFEAEFGKEALKEACFTRIDGFNWTYKNEEQEIILVCDFYEKKKKKKKVVKLSNGHVIAKKHYEDLLAMWDSKGYIEQPPIPVEERWSEFEHIVRYRLCDTKILSYDETDFKMFPLVFVDGNSVDIKDIDNSSSTQMTRPYLYHAKGIQRLKNFAGQTVGAEIENMVQHKFKVCVEAVPEKFMESYRNVQNADVLMYNCFYEGDASTPLPPPMEIQRTPTPPIVESVFLGSDRVTQAILGSYDAVMGTNEQNVSGVAISNGAIQSSSAATPYLMGYIKGLNRICEIVVDLIPKYYVTPRTIPVMTSDGKRGYQVINRKGENGQQAPGSIEISYKPHELHVKVEAGVNTNIQKQVALDQIIRLTQASPLFAQFINTEGLETLLDNMDIRGIDAMKVRAVQFMEQLRQQQQQQAQQPNPEEQMIQAGMQIEQTKTEQRAVEAEGKMTIKAAELAIQKQKVDAQVLQIMSEIEQKGLKLEIEQERLDSENARSAVETAMELGRSRVEHIQQEHGNEEESAKE